MDIIPQKCSSQAYFTGGFQVVPTICPLRDGQQMHCPTMLVICLWNDNTYDHDLDAVIRADQLMVNILRIDIYYRGH